MESLKKILIIDFCNYEDYPIGGYLTFAKNLMLSFHNELSLVGITTDKRDPIGRWFLKEINGVNYNFFALAKYDKSKTKNRVPDRLVSYSLLKYYKKRILSVHYDNIFIQRPEILLAVRNYNFKNICYRFAGLENPLINSKYKIPHFLAHYFENIFFTSFDSVTLILATGNDEAIREMIVRSKGKIKNDIIIQFPTRINTDIFKPLNKNNTRLSLNMPESSTIIATTGRLAWFKGWMFMIDCFYEFLKDNPNSLLYFIGEGEDRNKIETYITSKDLQQKIILAGKKDAKQIAMYLNAADVFIMGSYQEGWSTSLIEALACGVPICTTNFKSAKETVTEGVTGFVESHDVSLFVKKMNQCLLLDTSNIPITSNIQKYAVSGLKKDLLNIWKLI